MCRMGDLAWYPPDGNIEFFARIDGHPPVAVPFNPHTIAKEDN
jgi:hypothetical protein